MAENQRLNCMGHRARIDRKHTSFKLLRESEQGIVESKTIIIRKGPSVSVETSLKELVDIYKKTPEWDLVSNGGVLSVPVEELRTTNLPKPGPDGCLDFSKMKKGAHVIQNFPGISNGLYTVRYHSFWLVEKILPQLFNLIFLPNFV